MTMNHLIQESDRKPVEYELALARGQLGMADELLAGPGLTEGQRGLAQALAASAAAHAAIATAQAVQASARTSELALVALEQLAFPTRTYEVPLGEFGTVIEKRAAADGTPMPAKGGAAELGLSEEQAATLAARPAAEPRKPRARRQ